MSKIRADHVGSRFTAMLKELSVPAGRVKRSGGNLERKQSPYFLGWPPSVSSLFGDRLWARQLNSGPDYIGTPQDIHERNDATRARHGYHANRAGVWWLWWLRKEVSVDMNSKCKTKMRGSLLRTGSTSRNNQSANAYVHTTQQRVFQYVCTSRVGHTQRSAFSLIFTHKKYLISSPALTITLGRL